MSANVEQVHERPDRTWWITLVVVVLLMLPAVWYIGDRAYLRGQLSRNQEVADLNQKVADAALLLSQCKKDADLRAPIAKAQKSMADAALEAATKPSKKNSKHLTDSLNKLKALRDVPTIAGTTE